MRKFIVATRNKGKLYEIKEILSDFPYDVVSMEEAGISNEIDEYGNTFEENAMIKANEVWKLTGGTVMADDSGLEVEYLNGAPGVYSSRFGGENATDEDRNKKLLDLLKDVPFEKRKARFVCVIAVIYPDGTSFTVKGACEGYIACAPEGNNGFGYDPLFYMPEFGMTTAQMNPCEKHKISHRGKALRMMVDELKKRENETL
ncbi:MAG TPA: XTP/dITP diphosphatase [Clostridiales bacterium]|nr:XTP/dITP diphosphatase [Clostridiales bacterium]